MNLVSIKKILVILIKGVVMTVVTFCLCSLMACEQLEVSDSSLTISSEIFRCYPNDNLTFLSMQKEGIYYSKSVFDSVSYYFAEEKNNYKSVLVLDDFFKPEKVFLSSIIQPIGSDMFFVEYNKNSGTLNKINVKTKEKEKLFPQNICGDWIISGDKIIFEQNSNNISVLCYQSFTDTSACIISNDMESFAVCNNKVRYIEKSDPDMLLYEFDLEDKTTIKLGSFKIADYDRYSVSFSYGTDSIVFYQPDTDKNTELSIYSIKENKLNKYSLPYGISNICCAENYAFLSSNDSDGGIYRLYLTDGSIEKIYDKINVCLALYAIDDCSICVVFSEGEIFKNNSVYKISANGAIVKLLQY